VVPKCDVDLSSKSTTWRERNRNRNRNRFQPQPGAQRTSCGIPTAPPATASLPLTYEGSKRRWKLQNKGTFASRVAANASSMSSTPSQTGFSVITALLCAAAVRQAASA